jgi:protocatechuate 4,5-dioxygenase, beta chain
MARIVGSVMTSHVPAIGGAIARRAGDEAHWMPFFDGFAPVHAWLEEAQPDTVVVFYNDHGLNFFLDKMPTFAVGAAPFYPNADEARSLPSVPSFPGAPRLSWHIISSLVEDEFDVTMCQEMLVDHAFTVPMSLLWPGASRWPMRIVPIAINTVQHPLPSAARCFKLGAAVGRAVESFADDSRVLIVGTGGMSHQLDGLRSGSSNKDFDLMCLEKLVTGPEALTRYSSHQIIERAGTQGIEILTWISARGALAGGVTKIHSNPPVPISHTPTGLLLRESGIAA